MAQSFNEVIKFWFEETTPKQKWTKDTEFDKLILNRFGDVHKKAQNGELVSWRSQPLGALAEIIVLDQFSRNMYREKPESFASDNLASKLVEEAIEKGHDKDMEPKYKGFLYMPYMHSESKEMHERAAKLFAEKGMEHFYNFELKHKAIIDRFGRYPHRNQILGRESTPEEIEFLKDPASSF